MEVLFYRDPAGNFGDYLNAEVWKELLPARVFEAEDVILMGIGTIFNELCAPPSKTRGKRVFVLGSGAGYGPLPTCWKDWTLLAVRGSLTAALLNRPEVAVTDSAMLLAVLPQIVTLKPQRQEALFIPHHYSAACGQWKRVAEAAGLTYVDPRSPVCAVMDHFSRAKLVVTEAMHGAIVADTLRIPWIPVSIAPDALPFKWADWTHSIQLKYEPARLPVSSGWELLNHNYFLGRSKRSGVSASGRVGDIRSTEALLADFRIRYKELPVDKQRAQRKGLKRVAHSTLERVAKSMDPFFVEHAAKHLRRAVLTTPSLSRDAVMAERVEQLQEAVRRFIDAVG